MKGKEIIVIEDSDENQLLNAEDVVKEIDWEND
jgi:hypothetical protein